MKKTIRKPTAQKPSILWVNFRFFKSILKGKKPDKSLLEEKQAVSQAENQRRIRRLINEEYLNKPKVIHRSEGPNRQARRRRKGRYIAVKRRIIKVAKEKGIRVDLRDYPGKYLTGLYSSLLAA